MSRRIFRTLVFFLLFAQINFDTTAAQSQNVKPGKGEIVYHIFLRSFYDGNSDLHGDLKGIYEKLDYLQNLGVTSVLVTPTCESPFYHNYFSDDFEEIDPKYGTMLDWIDLVKEIHRRSMKIYLDMEFQYVTEDHKWYKDSYGNLKSQYSNFIVYDDSAHLRPEPIIFGMTQLYGYDGIVKKIAMMNLYDKNVQAYFLKLMSYWVDPNADGTFDDGVDGFRLDHMMDDLDWKGKLTDLFSRFWKPLLSQLKQVNPNLQNIAEQASWSSYGSEYFANSGVDRVFAFNLQNAIASFDANRIARVADSTFSLTPQKNQQFVFIENHDMDRFSSAVNGDPNKLRIAAALNLLIGGIPDIYYGQELGMRGKGGFGKFGNTDANDIPRREAFEWTKSDTGKGMALWYENSGPWWDSANDRSNDGISLEEEQNDPGSLYNFYKMMIHLRENNSNLTDGKYQTLKNDNNKVLSYLRYENGSGVIVVMNLSDENENVKIDCTASKVTVNQKQPESIFGKETGTIAANSISTELPAYSIDVWAIK